LAEKYDPTVTSSKAAPADSKNVAPPIEQADDAAVSKKYAENTDKPDPSTVAQVEVLPDDK